MYILLEAENNVALPYMLENGEKRVCTFSPGKNKVDDEAWKCILRQNAQGYEIHYSKFLRPFCTKFDTGRKEHLNDYTEEEMLEIVAQAKRIDFLEYLFQHEQQRVLDYRPRPAVLAAIQAKLPTREIPEKDLNRMGEAYRNYAIW